MKCTNRKKLKNNNEFIDLLYSLKNKIENMTKHYRIYTLIYTRSLSLFIL